MKYFNKTAKTISGGIGALALGLSLSLGGCDLEKFLRGAKRTLGDKSEKIEPVKIKQPYEGMVWKKSHEPERKWIGTERLYGGPPVYFLDNEDFIIKVMRENQDEGLMEQRYENKELYVNKKIFDKLEVGDKFTYFKTLEFTNARESDTHFERMPTKEELKKCAKDLERYPRFCNLKK